MEIWMFILVMVGILVTGVFVVWLFAKRKLIKDKFNLLFRKKRVVKVNFLTTSGRNEERFLVPDTQGMIHVDGQTSVYNRDLAIINARYRIPEITLIQNQIMPVMADIAVLDKEVEVLVPNADGTETMVKRKIPDYVLTYKKISAKKLEGMTAQEVRNALDSKIIKDIVTATNPQMQKLEIMFWIVIAIAVIEIIGFYFLNSKINDLTVQFEVLNNLRGKAT
jgi:hypothetical protein